MCPVGFNGKTVGQQFRVQSTPLTSCVKIIISWMGFATGVGSFIGTTIRAVEVNWKHCLWHWFLEVTRCEKEVLVGEVEVRKIMLFGVHSVGFTNVKKALEWQHVAEVIVINPSLEKKVNHMHSSCGKHCDNCDT